MRKWLRVLWLIARNLPGFVVLSVKRLRLRASLPKPHPKACKDYWFSRTDESGYAVCRCGIRAVDHRIRI
jgi:hypothetical protein